MCGSLSPRGSDLGGNGRARNGRLETTRQGIWAGAAPAQREGPPLISTIDI